MTGRNDIERLLGTFLAEGTDRVADRVIDAALDQIDHTPQRRALRVPWRFPDMNNQMRLGATAFVVVIALAAAVAVLGPKFGDIGGPTPTPNPTSTALATVLSSPTPQASAAAIPIPEMAATFVSPLHGYSIHHPATWTATPATARWTPGIIVYWGDPALDDLRGADVRLVAASQPLEPGQTPEEWVAAYAGSAPGCDGPSKLPEHVSVGGSVGTVTLNGCPAVGGGIAPSGVIYDVVVVVGGRAYDYTVDGIVDAAYVQALLATVAFDPASAIDPTPAPS